MVQFATDLLALVPFGLHFRQVVPMQPQMAQTTSEPEVTTGDGNDPEKIDSVWISDEDEDNDPPQEEVVFFSILE